jgi:hypothetical protein
MVMNWIVGYDAVEENALSIGSDETVLATAEDGYL